MRILATPQPSTNTPTCGNPGGLCGYGIQRLQKSGSAAEKLEYILAIELLSAYETQQFLDTDVKRSAATEAVMKEIGRHVPIMEQDMFLHPYIEYLRELIHSGHLIRIVESITGTLN